MHMLRNVPFVAIADHQWEVHPPYEKSELARLDLIGAQAHFREKVGAERLYRTYETAYDLAAQVTVALENLSRSDRAA